MYVNAKNNFGINFNANLTPNIIQQINKADISEIISTFRQKNINVNFANKKVVAWCCNKVVCILEELNKKFNFKADLPNGIFLEDFANLNIQNTQKIHGFCTLLPTKLHKNSSQITPSRTIFFNNANNDFDSIKTIDKIADESFFEGQSSSPHFLYVFLHEFAHVLHENNLLVKNKVNNVLKIIDIFLNHSANKMQNNTIAQICNYAKENPFEAIACDISKRILSKLDKNLHIINNPFNKTPYNNTSSSKMQNLKNFNPNESYKIFYDFWNGNV